MSEITVVPGFPDYGVMEDGTVWSRKIPGSNRVSNKWHEISGMITPRGYPRVTLYRDGEKTLWFVHRLILLTFVGPLPKGQETRHLDGDPQNNALSNLCYGTRKENAEDTVRHGRSRRGPDFGKPKPKEHGNADLTEEEVREIIRLRAEEGERGHRLAEMFDVSEATISMILSNKIWCHIERPDTFVQKKREPVLNNTDLTEDDVREIRRLWKEGYNGKDIAADFGITQPAVSRIVNRKTWTHVE